MLIFFIKLSMAFNDVPDLVEVSFPPTMLNRLSSNEPKVLPMDVYCLFIESENCKQIKTLFKNVNNRKIHMNQRSTFYIMPFFKIDLISTFYTLCQTIVVLLYNEIDQVISLDIVHKFINFMLV